VAGLNNLMGSKYPLHYFLIKFKKTGNHCSLTSVDVTTAIFGKKGGGGYFKATISLCLDRKQIIFWTGES
jgi:hypothetical protein